MSDKKHEEEIAKINDMIEDAASGFGAAPNALAYDCNIKTMAREIMRLQEERKKARKNINDILDNEGLRLSDAAFETLADIASGNL